MGTETVIFRGSPSLLTRFGSLFLATLILVTGGVLAVTFNQPLYWILSGVALLFILIQILLVRSVSYEITTERIRVRCGILTKRTDELELYRVRDFTLVEPFFLRMAGRGHIDITTMDPSNPRLLLDAIARPGAVREKLRESIEECRSRKGVRVTEYADDNPPPPAI